MEPFKALTFLAAAGVVSLVGAGAVGFYAGYSAGRGNLNEIKALIANAPVTVATGPGGTVSLKPVLDDLKALSRQVEALAAARPQPAADTGQNTKQVLDEIRALARQVETLKGASLARVPQGETVAAGPDYTEVMQEIREQVRALNARFDKQEPKAPKALLDEIRLLNASVQAFEPATRRAIAEEVRTGLATLQNAEPKVPKALLDEIRTISANLRPLDSRPQPSVIDQIKVLAASIEALKERLGEDTGRRTSDGGVSAEAAQLRQLLALASDQFGRCQTQLASLAGTATGAVQAPQPATGPIAVTQTPHREASAVVFFDNVMLKKDQEKQYDEIGVRLSLQSVGPREVRLAVNRQAFGLAFGERKVFRSQDVECELTLMETNLNGSQARVSISCKR